MCPCGNCCVNKVKYQVEADYSQEKIILQIVDIDWLVHFQKFVYMGIGSVICRGMIVSYKTYH